MCGIAGIVNLDRRDVAEVEVKKMMAAIKHRGPDDEGFFTDAHVGLGFVRLSIIDLSHGHQPMNSADGRYTIIFNGEIYNYIELREELKHTYEFETATDTEVILNAYREWGQDCLHRFNGMFAFVIYDNKTQDLFCARDRFGVKPFYYYQDAGRFIFASEPVAVISVLGFKPRPDYQRIYDFLVFNRSDHDEATFFDGITKLSHGQKILISGNKVSFSKWYNLAERDQKRFAGSSEFHNVLRDAVKLRMRSDVPVGLTLSGGLDSSSIAALLEKELGHADISTFSAVYGKEHKMDESAFIDLFRGQLKNMNFVQPDLQSLLADLDDLVTSQQEPFGSTSIYASYKIMKEAKVKVKVMLNGQGADEYLAGYHDFFGIYFLELLRRGRLLRLCKESASYVSGYRSLFGIKSFVYYLLPARVQNLIRIREKKVIQKQFSSRYGKTTSVTRKIFNFKSINDALLAHMDYKLEHLLKWDDRNSMRFGIESRNPFLDYRLVEGTVFLATSSKINGAKNKVILRDAMKGILPEAIRNRKDKIGFATPEAEWLRSEPFKKLVLDVLQSESFKNRAIIDPERALSGYRKHLNGEADLSKEIWKWINLELWFRKFID